MPSGIPHLTRDVRGLAAGLRDANSG